MFGFFYNFGSDKLIMVNDRDEKKDIPPAGPSSNSAVTLQLNESLIADTLAAKVMTNVFPEFNPAKDNWEAWKERIEMYFDELNIEDDKQKRILLLRSIGTEAYSVIRCLRHCPKTSHTTKLLS